MNDLRRRIAQTFSVTRIQYLTSLTGDGICELKNVLTDARCATEIWNNFLQDFVSDLDDGDPRVQRDPREI